MLNFGDTQHFLGVDMSINHGAMVVADRTGAVIAHRVLSTRQADLKLPGVMVIPADVKGTSKDDMHVRSVARLMWLNNWFQSSIRELRADLSCRRFYGHVEDYAYGASRGAHQIGEAGGVLRIALAPFCDLRFYSPSAAKSFAAGNGRAKKDAMIAAAEAWGVAVPNLAAAVAEDYCDAYALARMGLVEWQVRRGIRKLEELTQRERNIFLDGGKSGTNLLTRPYVTLKSAQ